MMNKHALIISVLALIAILAAACGGVSDPQLGSAATPSGSVAAGDTASTGAPPTIYAPAMEGTAEATAGATREKSGASGVATPSPAMVSDTPAPLIAGGATGATSMDTKAMLAQVMAIPGAFECMTSKLGMSSLMQLASRAPTAEETALLQACLNGGGAAAGETGKTPAPVPTSTTVPAETPKTLLARSLESPGLMWCLADKIGMETLIELEDRSPSSQESFTIRSCTSDTREIAAWNAEWPKRIDAAFTPSTCGAAPTASFPVSYYQGPLIDSHLHIPQLSDEGLGSQDTTYVAPRGAESDLYDTIALEQRPLLGVTMTIDRIACTLQNEGSVKAFAFFPTFPEITAPAIEVARRAVEEYPDLFVPFIQASANGVSTLEGSILDVMLGVEPGLFKGFGEVGDSPTEPINPAPDSDIYTGDFEVVRDRGNMLVYFHPGVGHEENLERALQRFPEVTFIIHADFVRPHVQGIMDRNPNVYYTYNDIFGDLIETFRFGEKQTFISDMRADWDRLLDEAISMYRPMIEAHPTRFMWGTDRGDIVWGYDEEVGQILAEFARAFIGRFDPAIQADLAYKNAERLIALTTGP